MTLLLFTVSMLAQQRKALSEVVDGNVEIQKSEMKSLPAPKAGTINVTLHLNNFNQSELKKMSIECYNITSIYHSILKSENELSSSIIHTRILKGFDWTNKNPKINDSGKISSASQNWTAVMDAQEKISYFLNLPLKSKFEGKEVDSLYLIKDNGASNKTPPILIHLPFVEEDGMSDAIHLYARRLDEAPSNINISLLEVENRVGEIKSEIISYGTEALSDSTDHIESSPEFKTSVGDKATYLFSVTLPKELGEDPSFTGPLSFYANPSVGLKIESVYFKGVVGEKQTEQEMMFGVHKLLDHKYKSDFVSAKDFLFKDGEIIYKDPKIDVSKVKSGDAFRLESLDLPYFKERLLGKTFQFLFTAEITKEIGIESFAHLDGYIEIKRKGMKPWIERGQSRDITSCGEKFLLVDASTKDVLKKAISFHLYKNQGTEKAPVLGEEIFLQSTGNSGFYAPCLEKKALAKTSKEGRLNIFGIGEGDYVLVEDKNEKTYRTDEKMIPFKADFFSYSGLNELYIPKTRETNTNKLITLAITEGPYRDWAFLTKTDGLTTRLIVMNGGGMTISISAIIVFLLFLSCGTAIVILLLKRKEVSS
jgi:hypothetical protein